MHGCQLLGYCTNVRFNQQRQGQLQNYFILDPFFLPMQQVDKGAIRFVLSGANIMCPGLTSPGAMMTEVPKDTIVVSTV